MTASRYTLLTVLAVHQTKEKKAQEYHGTPTASSPGSRARYLSRTTLELFTLPVARLRRATYTPLAA